MRPTRSHRHAMKWHRKRKNTMKIRIDCGAECMTGVDARYDLGAISARLFRVRKRYLRLPAREDTRGARDAQELEQPHDAHRLQHFGPVHIGRLGDDIERYRRDDVDEQPRPRVVGDDVRVATLPCRVATLLPVHNMCVLLLALLLTHGIYPCTPAAISTLAIHLVAPRCAGTRCSS